MIAGETDMFEPGDIVECVDAGPIRARGPFINYPSGLSAGAIYTVASERVWGAPCIELHEVRHPDPKGAFIVTRFRLLKRRDPELLEKLLNEAVPEGSEMV